MGERSLESPYPTIVDQEGLGKIVSLHRNRNVVNYSLRRSFLKYHEKTKVIPKTVIKRMSIKVTDRVTSPSLRVGNLIKLIKSNKKLKTEKLELTDT